MKFPEILTNKKQSFILRNLTKFQWKFWKFLNFSLDYFTLAALFSGESDLLLLLVLLMLKCFFFLLFVSSLFIRCVHDAFFFLLSMLNKKIYFSINIALHLNGGDFWRNLKKNSNSIFVYYFVLWFKRIIWKEKKYLYSTRLWVTQWLWLWKKIKKIF